MQSGNIVGFTTWEASNKSAHVQNMNEFGFSFKANPYVIQLVVPLSNKTQSGLSEPFMKATTSEE
jgi:hypothetical protein